MTDKELTKTLSPTRKRRRRKIEHESERFAPCSFALEKFLKERRKKLPLQTLERTKSD
ncbi:TPA: hypothetical protein ACICRN_004742 [Escherichia coli]|uniref:hypothetical protein n=1 Tax=Escherichia coli TaxID=562 RepID=UPI001E44ADC6|nr:hypothetical protein [Escherichia coli]